MDGVSKTEYTVVFNNPKKSGKNIQSIRYSLYDVTCWSQFHCVSYDGRFTGLAMIDQNLKKITYHIPFGDYAYYSSPWNYTYHTVKPEVGQIISDSDSIVYKAGTDTNAAFWEAWVQNYPLSYTVKAQNGSTQNYNVNLIIRAPFASPGQYCGSSSCGSQSAQVIQAGITGVQSIETIQVGPYRQLTPGNARVVSCPAGTSYDVCVENQNDGVYNYVLLGVKTQNSSTINLTISSSTINFGKSVVLTWDPTNMTSCTASGGSAGWEGGKDPSDGIHTWTSNGLAVGTYTYNISCITPSIPGIPGKTISSKAVVVVSPIIYSIKLTVPPSDVWFENSGRPYTSVEGNSIVITWDPTNMTSCTASGGSDGWAGDKDATDGAHTWTSGILRTGTYTYNISCTNGTKTISNTATATVSPFAGGWIASKQRWTPYEISNWTQLNNVRNYLTKSFILTTNLSSTTLGYAGIGDNWQPIGPFFGVNWPLNTANCFYTCQRGIFNGNGKTISDLVINKPGVDYVGLFTMNHGEISNLGLINANVTGRNFVGALAGVSWKPQYGALSYAGNINNSYSTGKVNGGGNNVGGLVGNLGNTINNSYSTAQVTVTQTPGLTVPRGAGGLVGGNNGTINNSYSTGKVVGILDVGGLVGECGLGKVSNSFWDIQTSEKATSGCGVGTVGKTTVQMKTPSTFATWDTNLWGLVNGSYPNLKIDWVPHIVTFDSQSATVSVSPSAKTLIFPDTTIVTLPTSPTKTGYNFDGWYTAPSGGGIKFTANTPVTANITVYAGWSPVGICVGGATDRNCWSTVVGGHSWGPIGITTNAQSITDGLANTTILAGLTGSYPAADYCYNLTEGGYSDWYLPSRQQLVDGLTAYKSHYYSDPTWGGFVYNQSYFSSTEYSLDSTRLFLFVHSTSYDGYVGSSYGPKERSDLPYKTRCLR